MLLKLKNFFKDESGASMVEYGVALLVVAAVGVTLMNQLGTNVSASVAEACNTLDGGEIDGTGACTTPAASN